MNEDIPRWAQISLKKPVWIAWRIYSFWYFRATIASHYAKGDISLGQFLLILLPARIRPESFDYFKGLPH
jgi:hypothetical protein